MVARTLSERSKFSNSLLKEAKLSLLRVKPAEVAQKGFRLIEREKLEKRSLDHGREKEV